MANQNTIADLDTTAANNLNFQGQSIQGTATVSTIDNMLQKLGALLATFYDELGGTGTVTGTANAILLTSSATAFGSLATGNLVAFKATADNTGAATINVDGLGAQAIRTEGDRALFGWEIRNNGVYLLRYDAAYNSAAGAWVLLNPSPRLPSGRLTLTSATPVLTSDVTAATTVYWTPYAASDLAELSVALDSNSGHTGYHQSGKNYDLFIVDDAGTRRLVSGPAWTNDTTRSAAISLSGGLYYNTSSMTGRFGSASGNTITVAAGAGLFVGTFRASADGQTQVKFGSSANNGGEAWVGLWNQYNRVDGQALVRDLTDSWALAAGGSVRSADNSNTNRASFVRGLDEDACDAIYSVYMTNAAASAGIVGIGLDVTNANSGIPGEFSVGQSAFAHGRWVGLPGLGFHFLQAVEVVAGTGSTTFYGDNASQSGYGNGLTVGFRW